MTITFFGQVGLPKLSEKDRSTVPRRIEALARQLVADGHSVTVFGTLPYLSAGNYHGIELKRLPSLDPRQPGGWVYLVFCLVSMIRQRPDVIHVHSYRAAILLALTHFLFPHTRVVWTIDRPPARRGSLPALSAWAARFVLQTTRQQLQASITTPSRTTQYRLLVECGIPSTYIPDGYYLSAIPLIPVSHFSLRPGQYSVALVDSPQVLRFVARAYKASKNRKKVVVLQPDEDGYKRLKKAYPFLKFVGRVTPRLRRSLIANAAAVMVGDAATPPATILEAMDAKRTIIAINEPRFQETLGTAAHYFAAKDNKGLTDALGEAFAIPKLPSKRGQAAATRAQRHFTWPRLVEEYHTLYAPVVRPVLLDSAYLVQFSTREVL